MLNLSAKDIINLIDCVITKINIKKDTLNFLQPDGKAFYLVNNNVQELEDILKRLKGDRD